MSRVVITLIDGTAALKLPENVLQELGMAVGEEVDISISTGRLTVRSIEHLERESRLREAADDLFERRRSAYQRLAE